MAWITRVWPGMFRYIAVSPSTFFAYLSEVLGLLR